MLSIARPFTKRGRNQNKVLGETPVKKFNISMGGHLVEIPLRAANGEIWLVRLDDETVADIHKELDAYGTRRPVITGEGSLHGASRQPRRRKNAAAQLDPQASDKTQITIP